MKDSKLVIDVVIQVVTLYQRAFRYEITPPLIKSKRGNNPKTSALYIRRLFIFRVAAYLEDLIVVLAYLYCDRIYLRLSETIFQVGKGLILYLKRM